MKRIFFFSVFIGFLTLNGCKQDSKPVSNTTQTVASPTKNEARQNKYPAINQNQNKSKTPVFLNHQKLNTEKNKAFKKRQIDSLRMKKNK